MNDIVREGNPTLTKVAEEVTLPASETDKQTLTELLEFLKNSQDEQVAKEYELRAGIGIAAPQIGLSKRMMAVHFEDPSGKQYSDGFFNPKIVSHSIEPTYLSSGEGCLSVDREVSGYVPRHARITVKATNLAGEQMKIRLKNYAAIVFQHEIDHLNGVMFYDRINKETPFQIPEGAKACDIDS